MTNTLSGNPQVRVVSTFSELVYSDFLGKANAICWSRNLSGDFNEIVAKLDLKENMTEVSVKDLLAL
ncbi:DUF1826 domain-containing protein, partial [Acinetobacter variabilis]